MSACNHANYSRKCGRRKVGLGGLFCAAAILNHPCLLRVTCTHYRTAAFLSASPQLAESIRAAKRFRVVPTPDIVTRVRTHMNPGFRGT
jgi:hypothetical protein